MGTRRLDSRARAICTRDENDLPSPSAVREALAVVLVFGGALTLLALISYQAGDLSLNVSGSAEVRNWIGPFGAYWADLLLQGVGLGAYPLSLGVILAGCRAFMRRPILPGVREGSGTLLLTLAIGVLAHLAWSHKKWPYPPGGLPGALVGQFLRNHLAVLGSSMVAVALALVALTLTADGVLFGLGGRGLGMLLGAWRLGQSARAVGERRLHAWRLAGKQEAGAEGKRRSQHLPAPGARKRRERGDGPSEGEAQALAAVGGNPEPSLSPPTLPARPPRIRREPPLDSKVTAADAGAHSPEALSGAEPLPASLAEALPHDAAPSEPALMLGGDAESPGPTPLPAPRLLKKRPSAEPQIVDVRPDLAPDDIERAARVEVETSSRVFELPPASLLDYEASVREPVDPAKLRDNALRLTKTLKDYGIEGHVREIRPGPVVTMYEYVPGPGIKLSKIASLADDLAMSMEALRVRIVAPIPGKGAVGIEIPNDTRETVYLKEIIAHEDFRKAKSRLTMALGKDIEGSAYVADLVAMPHLLVAGATGAGKSVSINAMIMSVLFKATPDEVRMIMVDPKMLELSVYEGIPHLLLPVVTDPKKAALAMRWAVEEMERRYELLSELGVRNIDGYNTKVRAADAKGQKITLPPRTEGEDERVCEVLPYLLVIVDELADLMMVASREVETSIMRLAQMARASGIHLILATQRPSVDVLTGVIKANFPTRIAFQVASRHDSRTIIDSNGAEHLLGRGDMLYLSPGAGGIERVHGAYVSDAEIERAVDFVRKQGKPQYDESILIPREDLEGEGGMPEEDMQDEMYDQAVAIVAETRQASISAIQRRLRIGYNRAARMVERMEMEGIVGPADGAKPREVLVSQQ